jgi:hypothetical protein
VVSCGQEKSYVCPIFGRDVKSVESYRPRSIGFQVEQSGVVVTALSRIFVDLNIMY